MTPPATNPILITTYRNGVLENSHRGTFVLVTNDTVVKSAGDYQRPVYPRSSLKSIQAIACVLTGAVEQYGLTPAELAIVTGSHWAEPCHLDAVRSILHKADIPETALQCGHHPLEDRKREIALALAGTSRSAVLHNCSGKHAGMLIAAKAAGAPLENYLDPNHPVQQIIRDTLVALSGCSADAIGCGVDGCAAPTFHLPMDGMARAFARMSTPDAIERPELRDAAKRILAAGLAHPEMVAGEKSFCTALMRAGNGMLYSKGGAEAYYAFGLVGRNTGFAFKLDDGSGKYVYTPFVIEAAQQLGALAEDRMATLDRHNRRVITNARGDVVGSIEIAPFEEF